MFFIATFLLPGAGAWADEPVETEVVESTLDPAKVAEKDRTYIKLSEDRIFELETIPDREAMKAALGLNIPEKIRQQVIARGGAIEEVDPLAAYESLPEEQRQKFKDMRIHFLTNAARILNSTKFALGVGSLVGDGLSFVKVKVKSAFGKKPEEVEKVKMTFKERSHQAVLSALKGIDYKLWSQAPLVIDSNEFGLSVSVGMVAETGVMRKGGGGAEELGMNIAFNKTQKAFVFEIFHNSERFDNTKAAVTVAGIVGKAGMSMGRRQGSETLHGSSFYPPAIPGYSVASPEYFSAGLSSSIGVPPPPLADLLTFTNKFDRQVLIRVTVSPVVKGFVRVQVGDVKGSVKLVTSRFADMFKAVGNLVKQGRKGKSCQAVFA
ncbi:MAG: hypothetical protein J7501_05210 [Bdellovibrio sp.]|nr:hypothetical protein [Bdellovibrio sp.]